MLLSELIPKIEATYRTVADREHRAMAGLSMGAMQTLQIAPAHTETFAYIGAFSPPPIGTFDVKTAAGGLYSDPAAFHAKVRLLWLGAGTAEERFLGGVRKMHASLDSAGITHVVFGIQRDGPRMADVAPVAIRLRAEALPEVMESLIEGLDHVAIAMKLANGLSNHYSVRCFDRFERHLVEIK